MEYFRSVVDFIVKKKLKDSTDPKVILNKNSLNSYVIYDFSPSLYGYVLPIQFVYEKSTKKEFIFVIFIKNRAGCFMYVSEEIFNNLSSCSLSLVRYMTYFPLFGLSLLNKFKYKGIFSF